MNRAVRFGRDISQYFYEKIVYNKSYNSYVLMFHVVSNDEAEWYEQDYAISADSFKELVEQLENDGYRFITPDELLKNRMEKCILLTFDDAFECIYYNVFPYLRDKKLPFIVFQTWSLLAEKQYLKKYMIEEMITYQGFTLGAHALEHSNLYELTEEESFISVLESKRKLEKEFGIEVIYMAYPYGSYSAVSRRDRSNVRKVGYRCAFSTINCGVSRKIHDKFFLPRVNVNEKNCASVIERCKLKWKSNRL